MKNKTLLKTVRNDLVIALEASIEIWKGVVEGRNKPDICSEIGLEGIRGFCPVCEHFRNLPRNKCEHCAIEINWNGAGGQCMSFGSPHGHWISCMELHDVSGDDVYLKLTAKAAQRIVSLLEAALNIELEHLLKNNC